MKIFSLASLLVALCSGCMLFSSDDNSCEYDKSVKASMASENKYNRIQGAMAIPLPAELSNAEVLDCVENAIIEIGKNPRSNRRIRLWQMEERDNDNKWITLGWNHRNRYLRVCYRIENGQLVPDVPASSRLRQDGNEIHRKAVVWINELRPFILSRIYEAKKVTIKSQEVHAPNAPAQTEK